MSGSVIDSTWNGLRSATTPAPTLTSADVDHVTWRPELITFTGTGFVNGAGFGFDWSDNDGVTWTGMTDVTWTSSTTARSRPTTNS